MSFFAGLMSILVVFQLGFAQASQPTNMETCFSPEEQCDVRLISFIDSSKFKLDVAIYNLTHRGIAKAIEDARARGVVVRIVVDKEQAQYKNSLVAQLNNEGFQIKFGTQNGPYSLMHDKFTLVDGKMLETGSYNYTIAATKNNHENQLYINEPQVVSRYQDSFEKMFAGGEQVPPGFVNDKTYADCGATPNPAPKPSPSPAP